MYHQEGETYYNNGTILERVRYISHTPVGEVIEMLKEMSVGLTDAKVEVAVDEPMHGGLEDQWILVSGKVAK